MQSVTLLIAGVGCSLVLFLRPIWGLVVYIAILLFYPTYLVVTVGVADISAARIVATLLLLKCLSNQTLRDKFSWGHIDTWVAFYILVAAVVMAITCPLERVLENRIGSLMDTWFVYIATRLCITGRKSVITFAKCIAIIIIPLMLLGVIESFSGWQPYTSLRQYCPWRSDVASIDARWGLIRAVGPFGHPIMFGSAFVLFFPTIYSLRHQRGYWKNIAYISSVTAIVGALSSMSSGPWMSVVFLLSFMLILCRFKKWIKFMLISFVVGCIFVEFASNRPFYHVAFSFANPIGGCGWHRAKLIDCAIEHFNEWYLVGYGEQDPGWGEYLGMAKTDITNHFILSGVRSGIAGVIALCGIFVVSIRELVQLHRSSHDPWVRSWVWDLGSLLATLIIVFMSVSLFGQTASLFYCILGIVGSSYHFVQTHDNFLHQQIIHYNRYVTDPVPS